MTKLNMTDAIDEWLMQEVGPLNGVSLVEYMREHVAYPSARAFFFSCRGHSKLDMAERRRLKEAERKRVDRLAAKGLRVCRVTGQACGRACQPDDCIADLKSEED